MSRDWAAVAELPDQAPQEAVDAAMALFGIEGEAVFLRRSQNYMHTCENGGSDPLILRLCHTAYQRPDEIASELDWHEHLARHGVGVSIPRRSRNGRLLETVEPPGGGVFSACAYERANGRQLRFHENPGDWDREIHREWGRLLGRLHRATSQYEPPPGITPRPSWEDEEIFQFANALSVFPLEVDPELGYEWRRAMEWMSSLPRDPSCYGLTHNDAHRGNFVVDDANRITLFDLAASFSCWYAYDLAQPLYYSSSVFFGDKAATPAMLEELKGDVIGGYREEFPLEDQWAERIDGFVQVRALQMHCAIYTQNGGTIEDDWFPRNRELIRSFKGSLK